MGTWFPIPRWKQHAAQSGYVYQYIFDGTPAEHAYAFVATSGPTLQRKLTVVLNPEDLSRWGQAHRPLSDVECFGIAKFALMRALDDAETPAVVPERIEPSAETIGDICRELDL